MAKQFSILFLLREIWGKGGTTHHSPISVVAGFIAPVSPDKISAPGNLIEHSKMKLLIKQNKSQHSPNIHKWKHTYLLTFRKQINKSVLFVVFKCRLSVVDCRSAARPLPAKSKVDSETDPIHRPIERPGTARDPFLRILYACVPFCRHFDTSRPQSRLIVATIDVISSFPIGFSGLSAIRSRIIGAKP